MKASKEEASKANKELEEAAELLDVAVQCRADREIIKRHLLRAQEFIEAAEKKLPTEAAFAREKERKKKG